MMKKQMHWVNLIDSCELERGDVTAVEVNGVTYAIYDTVDGIFVSDARCTHAGANLCDGYFDGKYIECPLHQGLFDARTGAAKSAPAVRALKMFESRIHHGKVQIRQ
ncbi:MAG: non-heme iron oxygenase ferredoxin subunit [Granulosicoccus sp.]